VERRLHANELVEPNARAIARHAHAREGLRSAAGWDGASRFSREA
jgi:hypothetical protein